MTREEMTPSAYSELLGNIKEILLKKGLKATTMDSIANALKISKRTLYEIFPSKNVMVKEALISLHSKLNEGIHNILANTHDAVEVLIGSFNLYREIMGNANADFFRDMDFLFPDVKEQRKESMQTFLDNFVDFLNKGVDQGYFRKDINFIVPCKMLMIQLESLKRMEELFPPDISYIEIYETIVLSFMRGMSTTKGMEKIDSMTQSHN